MNCSWCCTEPVRYVCSCTKTDPRACGHLVVSAVKWSRRPTLLLQLFQIKLSLQINHICHLCLGRNRLQVLCQIYKAFVCIYEKVENLIPLCHMLCLAPCKHTASFLPWKEFKLRWYSFKDYGNYEDSWHDFAKLIRVLLEPWQTFISCNAVLQVQSRQLLTICALHPW